MFEFCSLNSRSAGNCLLLQTDNSKVLVDVGISAKRIEEYLKTLEIKPNEIDGILLTHEHSDHIKGLKTFVSKYGCDVFVEKNVKHFLEKFIDTSKENVKVFNVNETFEIKDLKIKSFEIPHDAIAPCGFSFTYDNINMSVATDIGHMTNSILKNIESSNFILLESNYDKNVLMMNSYPYVLKQRIKGGNGHLDNEMCGKTIAYLSKSNLKGAVLGHMSENSNMPELAYKTVEQILKEKGKPETFELQLAPRKELSKVFNLYNYA